MWYRVEIMYIMYFNVSTYVCIIYTYRHTCDSVYTYIVLYIYICKYHVKVKVKIKVK